MIDASDLEDCFIEGKANQILQNARQDGSYSGNSHTPLDEICDQQLELKYIIINLPQTRNGDDIGGYIHFQEKSIVLNHLEYKNSYHKCRINFTIAHEIGHWILHKGLYDYDKPKFILLHTEFSEELDKFETQADFFAACLLMPKNLVIQKWNEYKTYSAQERRAILADFFRVSDPAMHRRLYFLKLYQTL